VLTRRLKDADVYLFFNESAEPLTRTVSLGGSGRTAETWDPATGTVSPEKAGTASGGVSVKLDLKAYETRLITVR